MQLLWKWVKNKLIFLLNELKPFIFVKKKKIMNEKFFIVSRIFNKHKFGERFWNKVSVGTKLLKGIWK